MSEKTEVYRLKNYYAAQVKMTDMTHVKTNSTRASPRRNLIDFTMT